MVDGLLGPTQIKAGDNLFVSILDANVEVSSLFEKKYLFF